MTQVYRYNSVDLGNTVVRLGKLGPLQTNATLGDPGHGQIELDDPAGTLSILGLKGFAIDENAGPAVSTLSGTVTKSSATQAIVGSGTSFLTQVAVGRTLKIPGGGGNDYVRVLQITDNTHLAIDYKPTHSAGGQTATVTEQRRLHSSFIGTRDVARGQGDSLITTVARRWTVELIDFNSFLGFHVFTESDANRPAETDFERVTWLLTSSFIAGELHDTGYVETGIGVDMDPADYRLQRPVDLLNDCAQVSNRNFYSYFDDAQRVHALWYQEWTNLVRLSPAQFSNVLTEVDSNQSTVGPTSCFAPELDATLHIDPSRVASGVAVPYGTGALYAYDTDSGTATNFGHRDAVAPNAHVSDAAKALTLADVYLNASSSEDYTIKFSARVNEAIATQIQAGDIVNCHFTHLPGVTYPSGQSVGYDTSLWPCRITNLTCEQTEEASNFYTLHLDVSPIPAGGG
jgi:hypothetical protein